MIFGVPDLGRLGHILSSAQLIILIFYMNGLTLKWFRLMYKVDNFDPDLACFSGSKCQIFA